MLDIVTECTPASAILIFMTDIEYKDNLCAKIGFAKLARLIEHKVPLHYFTKYKRARYFI